MYTLRAYAPLPRRVSSVGKMHFVGEYIVGKLVKRVWKESVWSIGKYSLSHPLITPQNAQNLALSPYMPLE